MIFEPGDGERIVAFLEDLKRKDLLKTRSVEKYSFGSILRSFYGLPRSFPLHVKSQHGVCLWDEIPPSEINARQRVMLVFSRRWLTKWRVAKTGKLVIGVPNPFLLYKQKAGARLLPNAAGSVFFYAHSTAKELVETNKLALIDALKNIPEDFGECLVAMHYVDMMRGEHAPFLVAGFKIFCAGHYSDREFVSRFYEMLSSRRFAISNAIGSHYFYSIEHGLPFSFIGATPEYRNGGYDNKTWREIQRAHQHIARVYQIRSGFVREISESQLQSAKDELGADLQVSHVGFWMAVAWAALCEAHSRVSDWLSRWLKKANIFGSGQRDA